MKIAYYSCYIGPIMATKSNIPYKPNSSTLKTQGIARALLSAGHEVTIYSPGSNTGHASIPEFEEAIEFPEGKLKIKYPGILSYPKFTPINDVLMYFYLRKEVKKINYDIFLYYNICDNAYLGSWQYLSLFKNQLRILEYEDSIFMKSLVGNKAKKVWLKKKIYNYLIGRTHGMFAVCKGMYDSEPIKYKLLTPGVINDDVIENVSNRINHLEQNKPVKIFLAGGGEYYKGTDLLIHSLSFVKYPCELHFFTNKEYFYCVAAEDIKKLPERHKVILYDYIPHEELIQILDKEADILANSTRSFGIAPLSAGFPSKMMEYAALGRPIVSSEIGKLDDEFDSKVTYYEKEDVQSIATCIEQIIENYDEKVALAMELQQIALSKYTINGTANKMKSFFNNIGK